MYKVEEKDLIGDIKGFPIEVVQKMVDEQVSQGNRSDVSIFQEYVCEDDTAGGFFWEETTDGDDFWKEVINLKNFDLFFAKYPKERENTKQTPDKEESVELTLDQIAEKFGISVDRLKIKK